MISRVTRNVLLALCACAALVGVGVVAIADAAGPSAVRLGGAPRHPAGSTVLGSLPAATSIGVTVTLKPRDPAALTAYATAVSTPGSSVYHRFLTVAEFRQRFGPTDSQIAAVESSLRGHGLTPGAVTANGLSIPVRATAGKLGRAFATSFQRVRVRGGRSAFANTSAPLVDSSVAGVLQGVIGLNNLALPRPLAVRRAATPRLGARATRHVVTGGPQPCSTASSAATSQSVYTADQIASAYGLPGLLSAGDRGAGQTVGIFELEGNFHQDITAFESCYGISASVTYQPVDGGASPPNPSNEDGIETELDVENVIGVAPQASVVVYQAPNTNQALLDEYTQMVDNSSLNVISTSWGLCESDTGKSFAQSESVLFQQAATEGKSVFAAAGDSGSEDCTDFRGNPLAGTAVDDPASQPFVTGAGGTSLTTLGPPPTESVWNDLCSGGTSPCGGGGGVSEFWKMPSYQSGTSGLNIVNSNSSGAPCGASSGHYCREVPDVSADADPKTGYLVYWNGNGNTSDSSAWTEIGGTSGAAPLWAGLIADVNASAACSGTAVGFANPALYGAAASAYTQDFNDVTSGNNDITGDNGGLYPAGDKYDMASGLGTPNTYNLATTLCADPVQITYPGPQTDHVSTANPSVTPVQIQAAHTGSGSISSYSATGLPQGVTIDSSTGLISGDPTVSGTYTPTITVTDTHGASNKVGFAWNIFTPVSLTNPGDQSSALGTNVNLQLTSSYSGSGSVQYSAAGLPTGLSIDPSTGAITGQTTATGTFPVSVTASDGTYSDTKNFNWTVGPITVSLTNPGNQVGIVNIPESVQAHASDNNGGAISYSASGLPPGISINATNGLMSGTPTTSGAYSVTLTATDGSVSQSAVFTWTISTATIAVANPGTQTGRLGTAAGLQIHAVDNNGTPLSYGASGLPSGLSINSATGLITGTPSTAGTFSVTVNAAGGGSSASATFVWKIIGPVLPSGGSLAGIAAGKPRLGLTLSAGTNAPGIAKLVIALPKGLSFTSKVGQGLRLSVPGGRLRGFKLKRSGNRLTITLRQPVAQVGISLRPPALKASAGLISSVKHKAAGKLSVRLTATDATGQATALVLKLKAS